MFDHALIARLYALSLGGAFLLFVLVDHSFGNGFWGVWSLASAFFLFFLSFRYMSFERSGSILTLGVFMIVGGVLFFPFWNMGEGETFQTVIRYTVVWPQILVLLFASRFMAFYREGVFWRAWSANKSVVVKEKPETLFSSFYLGGAFFLIFYLFLSFLSLPQNQKTPLGVLFSSLFGGTLLHNLTIFLFFWVSAYLFERYLFYRRSRFFFEDYVKNPGSVSLENPYLKCLLFLDDPQVVLVSSLKEPIYRFFKTMIALMPLLGFLGTIVGLAITIDAIPASLGGGGGDASVALSHSLSGIALKFQTTLLGVLGSALCSVFLTLLEKEEQQLRAQAIYSQITSKNLNARS